LSVLLHSQLQQLLGAAAGAEELRLVSLLVEDVDECGAGLSLCGEQAECFNRLGTYLCRCRKGYEDHSSTESGTLCIPAPRSGSLFLQYADMLVGAAMVAALATLVAAGAMCWQRWSCRRRSPSPEEPAGSAAEEPALELRALGECLSLDPFQLKLRARTPEWLWGARSPPGQACQLCLEQSTLL
ncbi:AGRE2 protein, partial [Indicator maculatus]|nr:AGRE2 protein [Indicator maculatus]